MFFRYGIIFFISLIFSQIILATQIEQKNFKNVFAQSLKEHEFSSDHNPFIYRSLPEMDNFANTNSASQFMQEINDRYQKISLQRLFENGEAEVYATPVINFNTATSKRPLTIVLVPGIFSEFIETRMFEEAFRGKNSNYRKQFYRASRGSLRNESYDAFTSLKNVTLDDVTLPRQISPLTDFFSVSNIGKNIKIIGLKTPLMSLETAGDIRDKAFIYNRRLNSFFCLMGVPENIVLLGYSRGAMISLEMLSQLKKSHYSWSKNIKAMVSLGGVVYGSDSADLAECVDPTDPKVNRNCTSLYLIKKLAKELEFVGQKSHQNTFGLTQTALWNFQIIERNNARWIKFFKEMAKHNISFAGLGLPQEITRLNFSKTFKDLSFKIKKHFSEFKGGDLKSTAELLIKVAFENFDIDDYVTGYDKNIKKFKLLVNEFVIGVTQLSTKQRLKWWRENNLPTKGIHYYSLAGSMGQLKANPAAYNVNSIDFKFLTATYNQYVLDTGYALNDSQVSIHKARFWPKLNSLLNPYYKNNPIKTTFLGVLGQHHWGMALEVVNKMKDHSLNPFPRIPLLESLATVLATDIAAESYP